MNPNVTYRMVASTLATIFFVFNIGLPLVVASCPMPKAEGSSLCEMCYDDFSRGSLNLTTKRDASCCMTKIAADRNTTEFLQSHQTLEQAKTLLGAGTVVRVSESSSSLHMPGFGAFSSPPPCPRDIPILVSSLLI